MHKLNRREVISRLGFTVSGVATLPWLSACAHRSETATRFAKPNIARVDILSAGAGSAFLPYAQSLATAISAVGMNAVAVETAGSIENVRRLDASASAPMLATVFLGTAHEAVTGGGAWTQGKKFDTLRAVLPMYETSFQCVALRRSGIVDIAGLRGKRVGVGPAGGPAEHYFKGLASIRALDAVIVNGAPAALVTDLREGKIDALWQGASVPIPAIKQITDGVEAAVFALEARDIAPMLTQFPALAESRVPANSYRAQTTELRSIAAWNFVMAHRDAPDDLVGWLVQSMFDATSPMPQPSSARSTRIEHVNTNRVVPFHTAAKRFYASRNVTVL